MSKPNNLLKKYLESLTKSKKDSTQLRKELRIHRKTEYSIRKKALSRNFIKMNDFGKYSLTILGKASLRTVERSDPQISFTVQSQVVDYSDSGSNGPSALCTIMMKDAKKIEQLDAKTDASKRFITIDSLWLPVNDTLLKASAATLVDTILDLKAKDIQLNTLTNQEFRDQFSIFNWHTNFPGYDFRRRYGKLAAETSFKVLIDYDGVSWSKVYNDEKMENKIALNRAKREKSYNAILTSDKATRIDEAISLIGRGTVLSETDLRAMRLFFSHDEIQDTIDNYLDLYKVEENESQRKKLVGKGFSLGLFEIEKKTLYHLKVNRSNQNYFRSFVVNKSDKDEMRISRNHFTKNSSRDLHSNLEEWERRVIHELNEFQDTFFEMMIKAVERFERAQMDESYKIVSRIASNYSEIQSIADFIQELLRMFYNKTDLYLLRSNSFWPRKITKKESLAKINSIVYKRVSKMYGLLRQLLKPVYGGDFNGYLDKYALTKMSSSMDLEYVKHYNNHSIENTMKTMKNSWRSLFDECRVLAYPEPQPLEISYKYDE